MSLWHRSFRRSLPRAEVSKADVSSVGVGAGPDFSREVRYEIVATSARGTQLDYQLKFIFGQFELVHDRLAEIGALLARTGAVEALVPVSEEVGRALRHESDALREQADGLEDRLRRTAADADSHTDRQRQLHRLLA